MTPWGDENGLYRQAEVPCCKSPTALEEVWGFTTDPETAKARTGDQAMLACAKQSEARKPSY